MLIQTKVRLWTKIKLTWSSWEKGGILCFPSGLELGICSLYDLLFSHNKLWKILKGTGIQDHLTCFWETCMQVKKQQLEFDMEQWIGSKLGKEYVKAIYCHPAYLTYMQNTSCKMPGWMKHKLKSRLQRLVQPPWTIVWRFLKKLEIELPYDPAIPLLGIHTKETRTERDMCTPMFITALFTIARKWKQPRCPLANKWIKKLWYIYTMEYYSAIKKNTFESVLMR